MRRDIQQLSKTAIATDNMKEVLFFLHIPKTAGTTLRNVLYRQYPKQSIFTIDYRNWPIKAINELTDMNSSEKEELSLVMGHMEYGWHAHFPNSAFTYMTMLREPVERIISHYYYERIKGRPFYDLANKYSLSEYLLYSNVNEIDNGLVRFLSGRLNTTFGNCDRIMLEEAKENISRSNFILGLTEYFDESLIFYGDRLNWRKKLFYTRKNTNKDKSHRIDEESINVIRETNKYDVELYAYAKRVFLERISEIPNFDKKVRNFRRLNYILGLGFPLYKTFKKIVRK